MGFSIYDHETNLIIEYITVNAAALYSGYSQQYLRRLLKMGVIKNKRIGQLWIINKLDIEGYSYSAADSKDYRFGLQGSPIRNIPNY